MAVAWHTDVPCTRRGPEHSCSRCLVLLNRAPFTYLGFKVNIGGGHFCDLKDADSQWDGAQHKQAVVDHDPGQDCMPDPAITADQRWERESNQSTEVNNVRRGLDLSKDLFIYLGDSEWIRAPCTNNAQVKFTTRKNILRLRKNNLRGSLGREKKNSCFKIRWLILQHLILAVETNYFCVFTASFYFKALGKFTATWKINRGQNKGYTYLYLVSSGEYLALALNMTWKKETVNIKLMQTRIFSYERLILALSTDSRSCLMGDTFTDWDKH